jgi:hypothetical protein
VRNFISLVALSLVLMVPPTATSQKVGLLDPSTNRKMVNGEKLKKLTQENNRLTEQYNEVLKEAKAWVNVDPEKLAPLARKLADNREKTAQLLEHYWEVDP